MYDVFTIRPKPQNGEALSSYLLRISNLNKCDIKAVYKSILNNRSLNTKSFQQSHQLDIFPENYFNLNKLSQLTGQSESQLKEMTFSPTINLFSSVINSLETRKFHFLSNCLEKKRRRFCSDCLNESGYYKLIWQVKNIEICDVHKTKLVSECGICHKEQAYMTPRLAEKRCINNCTYLFDQPKVIVKNEAQIIRQLNKYKQWDFLLTNKYEIFDKINGLDSASSLAIQLLYISQSADEYNWGMNILNPSLISRLREVIRGSERRVFISLDAILSIIDQSQATINDLRKVQVPVTFISSAMEGSRVIKNPKEVCLAPWCKSYGDIHPIKRIKKQQHRTYKHITYTQHSMCLSCGTHYGYDRKSEIWKSIGDQISLIQKIKSLVEKGLTREKIKNKIQISSRELTKLISYMCFHNLLPSEKYTGMPHRVPDDALYSFKKLLEMNGSKIANAKKVLNWNGKEYYYYFSDPRIQSYLYLVTHQNKKQNRKKKSRVGYNKLKDLDKLAEEIESVVKKLLNEQIPINNVNIALSMGTTLNKISYAIRKIGLRNKIETYQKKQREMFLRDSIEKAIQEAQYREERLSLESLSQSLGYDIGSIRNKFPNLMDWVSAEIKFNQKIQKEKKIKEMKANAERIINDLFVQNYKPNLNAIAKEMGITLDTLNKRYPEVSNFIRQLKISNNCTTVVSKLNQ